MDRTRQTPGNFRIVVLCGSSGSLMPFLEILRAMPHDSGMAFVVLTRRRSGLRRQLVTILATATHMPVQEVEDLTLLLPNCVYVMPAGKDITTDGAVFRLVPISILSGLPNGFDIFLTSLAENTKDRAVTIILSGLTRDASACLGDLRLSGGLAFAQSDARFSSMPESAVATGNVDFFCSAAEIGTIISALRSPLSTERVLDSAPGAQL